MRGALSSLYFLTQTIAKASLLIGRPEDLGPDAQRHSKGYDIAAHFFINWF